MTWSNENMDVSSPGGHLLSRLVRVVYPPRCVICGCSGYAGRDICEICYRELPWIESSCVQCAIPLADGSGEQLKCGNCLQKSPDFDHSLSLFSYESNAVSLVHQLKFNEKLACSRLLGNMLADAVQHKGIALPDRVLPVPLHNRRLRQRGFNQSIELARPIARRFNLSLDVTSVGRIHETRPQTGMNKKQRRRNMQNAFRMIKPVEARHVVIVDDVVTTTSTVNELARVLKKAGVQRVDVWSIARAV
jgi:ComF family protein